jgi:ABC-type transport system involved in cytochrome c biogenesis permease subunit
MTVELLQNALGWCALINLALLLWWFLFFALARDWAYRLHSRWFTIPADKFDSIHYSGMAIYKMGILFFNIVPYLALRIVT